MKTTIKDLREPWLVASWPGMGVAGLTAVSLIARQLGATPIGEVATSGLFDIPHLDVKNGVVQAPRRPRAWLLGWKAPPGHGRDLVLFLGEQQPVGRNWDLARSVAEAARQLGCKRVVTFAAMATQLEPGAPARVFGAASDARLVDELRREEVEVVLEGEVGGLNGLLVGAAAEAGIPGLCLLGELPAFAQAFPSPRASAAIVRAFTRLSGVDIDVSILDEKATEVDAQLQALQERAFEVASQARRELSAESDDGDDDEDDRATRSYEPEEREEDVATTIRLEQLFAAARDDRAKALDLKTELDRLGRFSEFEDRFLDLFKKAG